MPEKLMRLNSSVEYMRKVDRCRYTCGFYALFSEGGKYNMSEKLMREYIRRLNRCQ